VFMATTSLRCGRIVLGGILAECLLILAVIPMRMAGASEAAVTDLAVGGSFIAFVAAGWWLGRSLPRPILHGTLMGLVAAIFYTAIALIGRLFVADAPPTPFIYYVAHALKLLGGATGGWLAQHGAARATQPVGRAVTGRE
jgi:hypothetical protein